MKKSFLPALFLLTSLFLGLFSCNNTATNTVSQITVSFDGNGGQSDITKMLIDKGTPVSFLPKAHRENYEFSGWNDTADGSGNTFKVGTIVYSDIILYAQWNNASISIEYYPNGASGKKHTESFESGMIPTVRENLFFTRQGYYFSGWNTKENGTGTDWAPETNYLENKTLKLYAQWLPLSSGTKYEIRHYLQNIDGTYPSVPSATIVLFGAADSITTTSPNSYTGFTSPAPRTITINSDNSSFIDFYYERNKYTLTFDANGGVFPDEYPLTSDSKYQIHDYYGSDFSIPFVSRDGYDYSWNPAITNTKISNSDKNYTADWTLRTHSISYNLNGGLFDASFSPKTTFTELESITLPTRDDIIKDGYAFAGWYEDPDCLGTRVYSWSKGQRKTDVTLYVKWVEVSTTWAGMKYIDTSWYDASKNKFILKSAEEFAGMATLVNNGTTFEGKTIEMDFDLILNEDHLNYQSWKKQKPANVWTGIGYSQARSFKGIFDGKGHNIYGMYIDSSTAKSQYVGFFGYLVNGTIKNLNMVNSYVKTSVNRSAILAGYATNISTFENCTTHGIVDSTASIFVGGGMVGHCTDKTTFINCTNYADVSTTGSGDSIGSDLGGFTADCNTSVHFINCKNYGNVSSSKNGGIGGFIGVAYSGTKIYISNSQNYGNVSGNGKGVGGFIGNNYSGQVWIVNSTNSGEIKTTTYGAGGLVGYSTIPLTINNSANYGSIVAETNYAGGIVGYSSNTTEINNCFNSGKIKLTSGSSFGGIEGYRTSSSSKTSYSYSLYSAASKLFGNNGNGNTKGCGTISAYTSPVVLSHDITNGTESTTYTTIYADNTSTLAVDALNAYILDHTSVIYGSNIYELLHWTPNENGIPELQF